MTRPLLSVPPLAVLGLINDPLSLTFLPKQSHEIGRSAVGTLAPSTRTGSESNELHCKIEEIDAKIESLQAKRAKYASRLDRLQGKVEKLAGPIQWSAYQNLPRVQEGGDRTPEK